MLAVEHYERIVASFPPKGGKLHRRYMLISLGILATPVLIVKLYFHEV